MQVKHSITVRLWGTQARKSRSLSIVNATPTEQQSGSVSDATAYPRLSKRSLLEARFPRVFVSPVLPTLLAPTSHLHLCLTMSGREEGEAAVVIDQAKVDQIAAQVEGKGVRFVKLKSITLTWVSSRRSERIGR